MTSLATSTDTLFVLASPVTGSTFGNLMYSCVNLCFSTKDSGTHREWKYATFLNFTKSSISFVSVVSVVVSFVALFFSRHPKTFSTFFSENFFASSSSSFDDTVGHRSDSHATASLVPMPPPKAIIIAAPVGFGSRLLAPSSSLVSSSLLFSFPSFSSSGRTFVVSSLNT